MRLDNYLLQLNLFDSRTKSKQAIERGEIFVNGKMINKASYEIIPVNNYIVERKCLDSFVSLGGYKLKKALNDFNLIVRDKVCVDLGASTGGFTDCLLQNGAKFVYAIDLNDSLLHDSLKNDNRVRQLIKNVKEIDLLDFDKEIDLIVADLSFISATQVLHVISSLLNNYKELILLIKPQFETGSKTRFKNGIIRDEKIQLSAIKNIYNCALENNLVPVKLTTAPISNDKNIEFLMLFSKNGKEVLDISQLNIKNIH